MSVTISDRDSALNLFTTMLAESNDVIYALNCRVAEFSALLNDPHLADVRGRHVAVFHNLHNGPSGPPVGCNLPSRPQVNDLPCASPAHPNSLVGMPSEIKHMIYRWLPAKDCAALARTSSALDDACISQARRFRPVRDAYDRYRRQLACADDHAAAYLAPLVEKERSETERLRVMTEDVRRHVDGMHEWLMQAEEIGQYDLRQAVRFSDDMHRTLGLERNEASTPSPIATFVADSLASINFLHKQVTYAGMTLQIAETYGLMHADARDAA